MEQMFLLRSGRSVLFARRGVVGLSRWFARNRKNTAHSRVRAGVTLGKAEGEYPSKAGVGSSVGQDNLGVMGGNLL